MRTHCQIIRDVGVEALLAQTGLAVSPHSVRSWQQRDSIPGEYWALLESLGIATTAELAAAAAERKGVTLPPKSKRAA